MCTFTIKETFENPSAAQNSPARDAVIVKLTMLPLTLQSALNSCTGLNVPSQSIASVSAKVKLSKSRLTKALLVIFSV